MGLLLQAFLAFCFVLCTSNSHLNGEDPARASILTKPTLHLGYVNQSYEAVLRAGPGKGKYTWALASGQLPKGFKLDPAKGTIKGRTAQSGTFSFAVQVIDPANRAIAAKTFNLTIAGLSLDRYGGLADLPSPKGASKRWRLEKFGSRWM